MSTGIQKGLLILAAVCMLTGCSRTETAETGKAEDGRLKIYTSFYTMYDFTVKIAGDKADIINLVPAGTEPHDWEPSVTDMVQLEQADMLVYNGAGMEHWVERVVASLKNDIRLVETSKRLTLLEGSHSHEGKEPHGEDADPHVWLDVSNAKQQLLTIKEAMAEIDSENAAYYEENYERWADKLDELDQAFKSRLGALQNKDIIVAHEAFSYLCHAYGLTQTAIGDLEADAEPDARRLAEIIEFAKEKQIKTIFFEELVSQKTAGVIAAETGAETAVLNPLEGLTKEQEEKGDDYLSVMYENLEALEKALGS